MAATKQEHFDEHVSQVWAGIFRREENLRQPSLYVRDGKLVYLATGNEGDLEIIEHTGDSIAILAAASVFWYLGYQHTVLVSEPESTPTWRNGRPRPRPSKVSQDRSTVG